MSDAYKDFPNRINSVDPKSFNRYQEMILAEQEYEEYLDYEVKLAKRTTKQQREDVEIPECCGKKTVEDKDWETKHHVSFVCEECGTFYQIAKTTKHEGEEIGR